LRRKKKNREAKKEHVVNAGRKKRLIQNSEEKNDSEPAE